MTRDYISLGSSPSDEDCAQVGSDNYRELSRIELQEFKRMMEVINPAPEDCIAYYTVKSFPHDFGSYHELCAVFDDNDDQSIEWAFNAENITPVQWDNEAKEKIAAYNFNKILGGR